MHSFRYACLVHVCPSVARRHGLYLHPSPQHGNFPWMPCSYQTDELFVGLRSHEHSPVPRVNTSAWLMNLSDCNVERFQQLFDTNEFVAITLDKLNVESCSWLLRNASFGVKESSNICDFFVFPLYTRWSKHGIEKFRFCFENVDAARFSFAVYP